MRVVQESYTGILYFILKPGRANCLGVVGWCEGVYGEGMRSLPHSILAGRSDIKINYCGDSGVGECAGGSGPLLATYALRDIFNGEAHLICFVVGFR